MERGVAQRVECLEHHAFEARTCVLGLSTVLLGLGQVGARGLEAPNQKGGGGLSAGCEYQLAFDSGLVSVVLGGVHQHCVSGAQGRLWLEPERAVLGCASVRQGVTQLSENSARCCD